MNHKDNKISTNLLYHSYLGYVIGRKDLFSVCGCVCVCVCECVSVSVKMTAMANVLNRPILGGGVVPGCCISSLDTGPLLYYLLFQESRLSFLTSYIASHRLN